MNRSDALGCSRFLKHSLYGILSEENKRNLDIAIYALEKQIPKLLSIGHCACGMAVDGGWKYCTECGQRLKWISVEDRLPQQDVDNSSADCLVAIRYQTDTNGEKPTLCVGYLLGSEWWTYSEHSCSRVGDVTRCYAGDTVTHWMPLPEPPNNLTSK
ncbi:MAG: DUF551 domain-containing protein [Eubacteriales bacterium]|nr:DUF551 domain-containing protein [Eubacteriales bacterium]